MVAAEHRYSRVSRRMWRDEKFRSLSAPKPNGRDLWLFLLTGLHCTAIPGLFVLGEAAMAEELGWPLVGTRSALEEIERAGMARLDRSTRLVWLPNAIAHNRPENPNVVVGWRTPWSELPDCPLRAEACAALRAVTSELGPAFAESFAIALGEAKPRASANPSGKGQPKGLPNPSVNPSPKGQPKQDPDQDQEPEQESDGEARGVPPLPPPAAKVKKPKPEPAPDSVPLTGTPAARVYAAIIADAALRPITANPGDFAVRITADGAYPGVDVLAQVLRAGEFAAGKAAGTYSDGRAFLRRWLATEATREAQRPKPASPMQSGVIDVTGFRRPTAEPLAVDRPVMAPDEARAVVGSLAAQWRKDRGMAPIGGGKVAGNG